MTTRKNSRTQMNGGIGAMRTIAAAAILAAAIAGCDEISSLGMPADPGAITPAGGTQSAQTPQDTTPTTGQSTPTPANAATAGVFELVSKTVGKVPAADGNQYGTFSGSQSESSFAVTYTMKAPYEGNFNMQMNWSTPPAVLRPGEIIELSCSGTSSESGKDLGYLGSSGHWYATGDCEVLDGECKYFVGRSGSTGQFYPSGQAKTRVRIGNSGEIKLDSAHIGLAWGSGGDPSPCQYVYRYNANGAGGATGNTTPTSNVAGALNLSITATGAVVPSGTNVTTTATATGGTNPLYYFWFVDGDNQWTSGGPNFQRTFIGQPGRSWTVYCVVKDSAGNQSNQATAVVTIADQQTGCNSILGTWGSIGWGTIRLGVEGTNIVGRSIDGGGITLVGRTTPGAGACATCTMYRGTWSDEFGQSGEFYWTVDEERKSFDGRWSWDGNSYWEADVWQGSRSDCN